MKFKVGDRVKHHADGALGTVECVRQDIKYPFVIKWDTGLHSAYMAEELIQPETQEPVPGKFYRTKCGDKVLYVGKDIHQSFLYQDFDDDEFFDYFLPFKYFDDSDSGMDIVGEWTEEKVLPAVEIKRWAVIFAKDTKEGMRGESLSIHTNVNRAHIFLNKLKEDRFDYEIVELTGTLPERKVSK